MTVEDGLALRRISEAADWSYQVAPDSEPLLLSQRIKSSAVVFEVFPGFAGKSPFLLSVVQQQDQDLDQSFHLHCLETFLCSEDEFRLQCLCIAPAVDNSC